MARAPLDSVTQIERRVLWLYAGEEFQANLRREATANSVDADRLIFAHRSNGICIWRALALETSFSTQCPTTRTTRRVRHFGLACRSLPIPARAWRRVATSVLDAAGVPELAVRSLADYEALALSLARLPHRLAALRAKLAAARERSALFDFAGYCRHLEAAYVAMMQRRDVGTRRQ